MSKGHLKCQYISNNHPFLIIGPVKEEVLSLKPFIALYHEVITENQAFTIKKFAFPNVRFVKFEKITITFFLF